MICSADFHSIPDSCVRGLVLPLVPYSCNFDCLIMIFISRIQRGFGHRFQATVKNDGSIIFALARGIPCDSVPRRPNVASNYACHFESFKTPNPEPNSADHDGLARPIERRSQGVLRPLMGLVWELMGLPMGLRMDLFFDRLMISHGF